jgi:hypothetical protein
VDEKDLRKLFPEAAHDLLEVKGIELVEKLGMDAIRDVVRDVLSGVNLRDATETLTRRRISLLNAALWVGYLRGRQKDSAFPSGMPDRAHSEQRIRGLPGAEKRVLQWMLGLTNKQVQNVLRQDDTAWARYVRSFEGDLGDVARQAADTYGELGGSINVSDGDAIAVDWLWALCLSVGIGSQTLATRGSEKSMYGKFFEKLILGGVLNLMGLDLVEPDDTASERVYWLSSAGRKRESDATALFGKGEGIRFDIGFIGTGNTEISLDKVSRFEREVEIGGETHYMHTFIIVDRIGPRSRIRDLAREIDGTILQMSASFWPRELGEQLEDVISGFESPLSGVADGGMPDLISRSLATAPFERILQIEEEEEELEEEEGAPEADIHLEG